MRLITILTVVILIQVHTVEIMLAMVPKIAPVVRETVLVVYVVIILATLEKLL